MPLHDITSFFHWDMRRNLTDFKPNVRVLRIFMHWVPALPRILSSGWSADQWGATYLGASPRCIWILWRSLQLQQLNREDGTPKMPIPVDWVEQFGEKRWENVRNLSIPIRSCCLMPFRSIPCSLVECKLKSNPPKNRSRRERHRVAERSSNCPYLESPRDFWIIRKALDVFGCLSRSYILSEVSIFLKDLRPHSLHWGTLLSLSDQRILVTRARWPKVGAKGGRSVEQFLHA